jgi:hypothetical protein
MHGLDFRSNSQLLMRIPSMLSAQCACPQLQRWERSSINQEDVRKEMRFPAQLKGFHFHPYRDPQEHLVTLETQDFLYVWKRHSVFQELFYQPVSCYFAYFLSWFIAGNSWPRWSTRSPRYPRMQWYKGKFRTETPRPSPWHVYVSSYSRKSGEVTLFYLLQLEIYLS